MFWVRKPETTAENSLTLECLMAPPLKAKLEGVGYIKGNGGPQPTHSPLVIVVANILRTELVDESDWYFVLFWRWGVVHI